MVECQIGHQAGLGVAEPSWSPFKGPRTWTSNGILARNGWDLALIQQQQEAGLAGPTSARIEPGHAGPLKSNCVDSAIRLQG
jgi:hypothetical protein